jgi:hypothetical protein
MSKLEQLLKQQQEIAAAIEAEKNKGREEALATVRSLCKQYSITLREVKAYVLQRKQRVSKDGASSVKTRVAAKKNSKSTRIVKK